MNLSNIIGIFTFGLFCGAIITGISIAIVVTHKLESEE
jgi:hypothetical protein